MEVYESIIVKVIVMLDEVEYDIIYNQKDKDLIYEDLSNIIKIAIDTKDFFKHIYYDQKQKIVLEEVKSDEANRIFEEFGLDGTGHIINGHVPVHQSEGENPLKCDGKVIMIDGGFSKPYHKVTGIAGYTLVYNSYGLRLVSHEPFKSRVDAIINEKDIHSDSVVVEKVNRRHLVADTDAGKEMKKTVEDLIELLNAYKEGLIPEKF